MNRFGPLNVMLPMLICIAGCASPVEEARALRTTSGHERTADSGGGSQSGSAPMLLLDYEDFGPQVMAHELIGFQWYQWDAHGSEDPGVHYDIRVVVHEKGQLEQARKRYPVVKGKTDYRYVDAEFAIAYLDRMIADCESTRNPPEDVSFDELAHTLRSTLDQIKAWKGD